MSANNNNDKFSHSKNESIKSNLFRTHIYVLIQGTKLTFLARSHLAPKFSKVVAKAEKLGAIKKIYS